jgi:hypothetical protein
MTEIQSILKKINDLVKIQEDHDICNMTGRYGHRLNFLVGLVEALGIEYFVRSYDEDDEEPDEIMHNLVLPGNSELMVVAHYDVFNTASHNANDNSASIINAIALKVLNPEVTVVLTDGEEQPFCCMGTNYLRFELRYNYDYCKHIRSVLVLELTGYGKNVAISNYGGHLLTQTQLCSSVYVMEMPKSEAFLFRRRDIDSEVVTCYPEINGRPDFSHFEKVHTEKDNIDSIKIGDMEQFVSNFLYPLSRQIAKSKEQDNI